MILKYYQGVEKSMRVRGAQHNRTIYIRQCYAAIGYPALICTTLDCKLRIDLKSTFILYYVCSKTAS
jgi:hypothetical protein